MLKRLSLSLTLIGALWASPLLAQSIQPAPSAMNFQGRLVKPDGTPVPDGSHSVRLSLHDALTGGTEKWSQTVPNLQVKNGVFAALLSGFPAGTFHGDLWLEIKVGEDAPLTPRQQLVSVAFAMKANSVPDGAIGTNQLADGAVTVEKFASNVLNPLAWLLGGNSGTNPASHFIGTTDNQPLVFRTNNAERMRALSNGRIGVGTSAPNSAFHIFGPDNNGSSAILQLTSGDQNLLLDGNEIDALNTPLNLNLNSPYPVTLAFGGGGVGIGVINPLTKLEVSGNLHLSGQTSQISAPNGQTMHLGHRAPDTGAFTPNVALDASGKVGIGTETPAYRLHIIDDAYPTARIESSSVTGTWLGLSNATTGGRWWNFVSTGSGNSEGAGHFLIRDEAANTVRMAIAPSGRIGIGTVNPAGRLHIVDNGVPAIRAESSSDIGTWIDLRNTTTGGKIWSLISTGNGNTEGTGRFLIRDHSTGNVRFTIAPSGRVGIGTVAPGYDLDVVGDINASSQVRANGVVLLSDARYKTNVQSMENALETILNLRGVTFDWNRADWKERNFAMGRQIGFIAQEVEKVLPELIQTDANGYKAVAYQNVVPVLVEAVKTQQQRIEAVSKENAELKAQLAAILQRLERIEAGKR